MKAKEFKKGRILVGRLPLEGDLLGLIEKYILENNITQGHFSLIGGLKSASYGYYNTKTLTYDINHHKKQCEILSCIGNISIKEGKPFVHAHITISDEKGRAFGGHLVEGCEIFLAEIVVRELVGAELVREFDENMKLFLWKM